MDTFRLLKKDNGSNARCGILSTAHGTIETPVFMPVGTRGSVKGLTPQQLIQTNSKIILANTYHMMIRPGAQTVKALGDLHKLMAWQGPILTDSGGYQVFSLSTLNRIGDDGVQFASHIDGAKIYIDAKVATQAQNDLGADIIMCFDECPPFPSDRPQLEKAVERTIRWAGQCKEAHARSDQLLFGIVQGGIDFELRTHCAQKLIEMDFDGYAVGGVSVGEGHEHMIATTRHTAPILPENKPRYLMGVGMPQDIIAAVHAGIDMFDCVLPSRNGRNAFAFTKQGPIRLRNSTHTKDTAPIDQNCPCYCCKNFSRGTLRHFFNVGEMLGPILATIHNITFFQQLMAEIRQRINDNTFTKWAEECMELTQNQKTIAEYTIL
ncbi:MAG: tRNA guanosine(34) transglycosylase Tgt [Anaerohalosphaera sp.]|nr:tRNA guanosine(34) transglycosylase Tgt [Anaerohalosphaera sp.]